MALSEMSGSVSAKLAHYWKFETESDYYVSTNDFVYDEINSLDLSLRTSWSSNSSPAGPVFGVMSGIQNQNKVIARTNSTSSNITYANASIAVPYKDATNPMSGLQHPDDVYKVPGTYVAVAAGNSGVSGSFTVAGWYFDAFASQVDDDIIFSINGIPQTTTTVRYIYNGTFNIQRVNSTPTRLYAVLAANHGVNNRTTLLGGSGLGSANIWNPNGWNHFAYVVDSENTSGFLYINGLLSASGNSSYYSSYNSPKSSYDFNSDSTSSTATRSIDIFTRYFNVSGCVAEIGIFSGVLSQSEISHLYNNGSGVTVASNHSSRVPVASDVYNSAVHDIKFSEDLTNLSGVLYKDTIGNLDISHNENQIFTTTGDSDIDNSSNWWESETSGVPHTRALSSRLAYDLFNTSYTPVPYKEVYNTSQSGTMDLAHYSGAYSISMWIKLKRHVAITAPNASIVGFGETRSTSSSTSKYFNSLMIKYASTYGGSYFHFENGVVTSWTSTGEFPTFPTDNWVGRGMLTSGTLNRWYNVIYTYDPYKGRSELWVNGSGYGNDAIMSNSNRALLYWGPWNKYRSNQNNYLNPVNGHMGLLFGATYVSEISENAPESGLIKASLTTTNHAAARCRPSYANYTIFNKALYPNEIEYIYNNGTGNFATIKASGSALGNFGVYQYAATPISGSVDTEAVGTYLNQYSIATDSTTSNIGAYSNQYAISQGSSLASVGTYSFQAGILSGSVVDFKIGATMFVADLFSGTGSGSVGTNLNALSVISNQQSSGLIGTNLNALSIISNQQSSGLIGTRLIGLGVASGSSDALSIGSYAYGLGISQGSETSNVGVYSYEAAPISGVVQNTFLGVISEQLGIPQGSKLTDIATYSYQAGPVTGSTDIGNIGTNLTQLTIPQDPTLSSLGTYLTIQQAPNLSGSFVIKRPPIAAWSWDISKNDPSGYRTIESKSSPYYPSAKKNMIGGFDAQNESGVSINFGEIPEDLSSDFTSDVQCMTIQTSNASGIYFDQATSISSNIPISDTKVWLADQTDITTSGIDLKIWYKEDANWLKNTTMTSGSSGVSLFPTSEASAINLGDIGSGVSEFNISNYIYMIATLPSGAYNRGGLGGLGSNWNFKVSYSLDA